MGYNWAMEFVYGLIIGAASTFILTIIGEFSKDAYQRIKREWIWIRSPYVDIKDPKTGFWTRRFKRPKFYHKKI
jgi:hypothetical protein